MSLALISRMEQRVKLDKEDSDSAYFDALIRYASLCSELATLIIISGLINDKDRLRYKFLYEAIRVDSPGGWQAIVDSILTGPAGQFVHPLLQPMAREFSERVKDGWPFEAVKTMANVIAQTEGKAAQDIGKAGVRDWIRLVAELRNKQLSHGFPTPTIRKLVLSDLDRSVRLVVENLKLFNLLECAYLSQNLSGKYRVLPVSAEAPSFSYLKSERHHNLASGLYMWLGAPVRLHLVDTDVDLSDFFVPNGGYGNKSYETYSYVTGQRRREKSDEYDDPPVYLVGSETEGLSDIHLIGGTFTNIPSSPDRYITRHRLEAELSERLLDDYTRIITLNGRGGIGKTSLALKVLHQIAVSGGFNLIVWFSARDIDLADSGPKPVRPQTLTESDIAVTYFKVLGDAVKKGEAVPGFEEVLAKSAEGSTLFVFDNFETVQNPAQLYAWIDRSLRLPNKVLITTRLRQAFKGDYQIDVSGMDDKEAELLVDSVARYLSVESLINDSYRSELIREADGHPYVLKILVSAVKKAGRPVKVERLVSGASDILTALFERTYVNLSLPAQRIFLTLCSWRSVIPRVALEAVILRRANERIDVVAAVNELVDSSLIEIPIADREAEEQIVVPLTAAIFGRRKLAVSPLQTAVQADVQLLQMLGPTGVKPDGITAPRFDRLLNNIEGRLVAEPSEFQKYAEILEYIASSYPDVRLRFARLAEQYGGNDSIKASKDQLLRALEECAPDESGDIWRAYVDFARRNSLRFDELHGLIQLASVPGAEFEDISEAANRFNSVFRDEKSLVDSEERRLLILRLAYLLESRIQAEGNADDHSRLAWLYLNIGDDEAAGVHVLKGLSKSGDNEHLRSLAWKLNI